VGRFGLEGGAASAARGAGFAADLLTGLAVGGAGSKAVQGGRVVADDVSRTVNTYQNMSPENQALYLAMLRGLYHGNRSTGANIAQPFTAVNRSANDWARNWFGGDMFGVRNPKVAEGYTTSNAGRAAMDEFGQLLPGFTREGFPTTRGAKFRLSEPIGDVANRRILDLTGRTLDEADPALYRRLAEEFADDIAYEGFDLARMDLSGLGGLHQSRYSERLRPILDEFGYDTVRHLSGQLQGDIVSPVYAFLDPQGIQATPTLPSLGRMGDLLDAGVSSGAQRINQVVDPVVQGVKNAPKTFADTLASTMWDNDLSRMPGPIRNFVEHRTRPLFFGEGFPDTVPHSVDDRLGAFMRRLGVNKLWKPPPSTWDDLPAL
jgi:hypothetical protein